MEQTQRLDYLVEEFKIDSGEYKDLEVGDTAEEKRVALRSLMNIRMPRTMCEEVVRVQDEFLQADAIEKGIVRLADIPTIQEQYKSERPFGNQLSIWQGDITRLERRC